MAACTTASATSGADTIVCNDADNPGASAGLNAKGGGDNITVNGNPTFGISGSNVPPPGGSNGNRTYSLTGGTGNDTIIINGGHFLGTVGGNDGDDTLTIYGGIFEANVAGDGRFSIDENNGTAAEGNVLASGVTGNDIITFYSGTVKGEVQGGNGDDTIYIYGGNINRVEGNASSSDGGDKIYLDGATASLGSWEGNSASQGQTLYIRNGSFGLLEGGGDDDGDDGGELNTLTSAKEHLIIDPVNSRSSTPLIKIGIGVDFAGGNDTLTFIGAVMNGDKKNLEFADDDIGFVGGAGDDTVTVTKNSDVVLEPVSGFEHLVISDHSKLELSGSTYAFGTTASGDVTVSGTSELHLSDENVTFTTSHFVLESGSGLSPRLTGLPEYYASFATGGVLRIGAAFGGAPADEDDLVALDNDDNEEPTGSPSSVLINVGSSTFANNGTITLLNGIVGDALTISDNYQSTGGNLAIDTELGESGSPSDRLVLQQGVAGITTVFVNNVGGTGAFTGSGATDGIEIASSGAVPFLDNSFVLATNAATGRAEVIGGAFAYQLVVTPESALLQSDILDQVPAYAMSNAIALNYAGSTFDTLYKRLGEVRLGQGAETGFGNGGAWVKGNYADNDVDPKSGYAFSQRNQGVLFGFDKRIEDGPSQFLLGLFGGVGSADADVYSSVFGSSSRSRVDIDARTFGAYFTYSETRQPGVGFYTDLVVKYDDLELDMSADSRSARGTTDGFTVGGSGEVGYGFNLGGNFVLQPQGQLTYAHYDQDEFIDAEPYELDVKSSSAESLVGRAGLQLQANYLGQDGSVFAPYAIINALTDFRGDSTVTVAGTPFASDVGVTWYNVGGGFTADLGNTLKVYGSAEYNFGDVEGWGVTGGGKLVW